MLSQLTKVQEKLFSTQSITQFFKVQSIFDVFKMLNKTTKNETINRLTYLISKVGSSSQHYKILINAALDEKPDNQLQFTKYVMGDRSEQYFITLSKYDQSILNLLQHEDKIIEGFIGMLSSANGLKMVNLLVRLYKNYSNRKCLYTQPIYNSLKKGLKNQNSQIMMRYIEVIANIVTTTEGFNFIEGKGDKVINEMLETYQTQDALLKINIVQVVSILGNGIQSSKQLYENKMWKTIEKQAMDKTQQFYIRKYLLILLVSMGANNHIQLSNKSKNDILQFLSECFAQKGQTTEGALQIIAHLFQTYEGCKLVVSKNAIFEKYCQLSRTTDQRCKTLYLQTLVELTSLNSAGASKTLSINILNCIGNPNFASTLTHNLHANNHMVEGIQAFCKWFIDYIILPFEDSEMKLLVIMEKLLQFYDVCLKLFQNDRITKYLLKKVANIDNKVLKGLKSDVIRKIIQKADLQWKGLQLQAYSRMLQTQLKGGYMELEYATQAA